MGGRGRRRAAPARSCSPRWTATAPATGFDLELTRAVADAVGVPVIASGGVGTLEHLVEGVLEGGADAVLAASIFHFGEHTIAEAKALMADRGITVRPIAATPPVAVGRQVGCDDHDARWSTAGSGARGIKVSVLSFGSWVTFDTQLKDDLALECMQAAHDAGCNFFDNAEAYAGGESEAIMGRGAAPSSAGRGGRTC